MNDDESVLGALPAVKICNNNNQLMLLTFVKKLKSFSGVHKEYFVSVVYLILFNPVGLL